MEKIMEKQWDAKSDKNYPPEAWRNPGSRCADNGYVLIFVLWAVVILGFVASSFSGSTRNIIKLEKASAERTKNLYATRGASIYAMSKVAGVTGTGSKDVSGKDTSEEEGEDIEPDEFEGETGEGDEGPEEGSPSFGPQRRNRGSSSLSGGISRGTSASKTTGENKGGRGASDKKDVAVQDPPWVPNLTPYSVFIGDKECKVYIEDESGKININAIDDKTRGLLVEYLIEQKFDRMEADIITDAVLDWKDGDDLKHLNGAETDYYKSLPDPYEAKNVPFDSIEEFALVRGMTPDKFDRVRKDITVYGSNLAININFASREVLMAIPRITPEGADYIIAQRTQNGLIKSVEDVRTNIFWHLGIIGSSFEEIKPYITVDNSGYMTIRAACEANGVSSAYRAIINKAGNTVNVLAVYPD